MGTRNGTNFGSSPAQGHFFFWRSLRPGNACTLSAHSFHLTLWQQVRYWFQSVIGSIRIDVEPEENRWRAHLSGTNLYGYGESPEAAIGYLINFHRRELGFIIRIGRVGRSQSSD
jgi:hypothetical protein